MKDKILKEYDQNQSLLNDLTVKIEQLIEELLKSKNITIHQLSKRLKKRDSLEKKILSKNDKYSCLAEITDVVGLRVITYLESDVDTVAELFKEQFQIDANLSVDKRKLDANQFGYKSLHLIASFDDIRKNLPENIRFNNIKFEIQIRSILQHAWAEIEHDLGYKGIATIPETAKRTFNRLSALLEITDIEFDRLKNELTDYESKVSELISKEPENVLIDQASLIVFIENNPTLQHAKTIIQHNTNCIYLEEDVSYEYYINILTKFFHINTIKELALKLSINKDLYLKFVDEFSKNKKFGNVVTTINVFYFCHFLSSINEDQEERIKYLHFGGMLAMDDEIDSSDDFIKIIQKIKNS